jgi:hypothetical protein
MVSRTEPKDKRGEGMEGSVPEKERERACSSPASWCGVARFIEGKGGREHIVAGERVG